MLEKLTGFIPTLNKGAFSLVDRKSMALNASKIQNAATIRDGTSIRNKKNFRKNPEVTLRGRFELP